MLKFMSLCILSYAQSKLIEFGGIHDDESNHTQWYNGGLLNFTLNQLESGDIFVQKSPATTIETLCSALKNILDAPNHLIEDIGTRHGEKLYETLLSIEEMSMSIDLGDYFKVKPDVRDLNYERYFEQGNKTIPNRGEGYNSHNTNRLDTKETEKLLLKLPMLSKYKK